MRMKRLLTAFLALVMVLSVLPAGAMAVGEGTAPGTEEKGKLFMDKTANLNDDGSYTIRMEAFATGKTTTQTVEKGVPLDIVLVIDQSGSLHEKGEKGDEDKPAKPDVDFLTPLKASVQTFIDKVQADGAKHHVEHRIGIVGFASGEHDGTSGDDLSFNPVNGATNAWVNTGIWDANGDFKNYKTVASDQDYIKFNGTLVSDGAYFVQVQDGKYVKLTHVGGDSYEKVANPSSDRNDIYGLVNGKYVKAAYGEYQETVKTEVTPVKGTEGYVDENGNPLTWKEITTPGNTAYKPITGNIELGKTYWIKFADGNYHSISYKNGKWTDDEGADKYTVNGTKFHWPGEKIPIIGIVVGEKDFDAYDQIVDAGSTETVLTTVDGKEYTGKVYTQTTETKNGWLVNGNPVSPVYELRKGAGKWQYKNGKKTVTLTNEQVFIKAVAGSLTSADYQGALVPVSVDPKGQGAQRPSLRKAVNSFGASGATRMATGIEMGNWIFANNPLPEGNPEGRQRIMIIFTDGVPGYSTGESYACERDIEEARAIEKTYWTKNTVGASVYTIGLYQAGSSTAGDQRQHDFMSHLSSNYPEATYNFKNITELPSKVENGKHYGIEINGTKMGLRHEKSKWSYHIRNTGDKGWNEVNSSTTGTFFEYTPAYGTAAPEQKYSFEASDSTKLDSIFQSIQQDISGSTTSVNLDKNSILRDIMAEGFIMNPTTTVKVEVVPGDATNAADETEIAWGTPVEVLTLNGPTDGKTVKGTYTDTHDPAHTMTIKATTYTDKTDANKKGLHTVDITGFDYQDQYIAKAHKGSKLVVTVTYITVMPGVPVNEMAFTNNENSGIWNPGNTTRPEGFFPHPSTKFVSKTFVQDYAKPMDLPLADLNLNSAINLDSNAYNAFTSANTALDGERYGNVTLTKNNKLTYIPKTMQWDGYDTFYVFGRQDGTIDAPANHWEEKNGTVHQNLWTEVKVIPANNVYYEDSFITTEGDQSNGGTVGIVYGGHWSEIKGTAPDSNNAEPEIDAVPNDSITQDSTKENLDNHGWIPALQGENGDTDGSSHHAAAGSDNFATATFTFTGTGVDIYSRTNDKTGTVRATIKDSNGKTIQMQIMDTLSASGEYFQIPTLTFHDDGKGNALPHGTYTVTLKVTSAAQDRYEYYLDGIRVYNPLAVTDAIVDEAYGSDELNASFTEIRDKLITAKEFINNDTQHQGAVFIDQLNDASGKPGGSGNTNQVGVYEDIGPKNEVYLKPKQSISFKVNHTDGNSYYVGIKSMTSDPATVAFTGSGLPTTETINHTADMYYKVEPSQDGIISIGNNSKGGQLLSITKLKVTNANEPVVAAEVFAEAPASELLRSSAQMFSAVNAPAPEPEVPNVPDVEIENPGEDTTPEKPDRPEILDILDRIFGGIRHWF